MMEARVIEVPIDNSNDVLEIDCSQLPAHAAEICDILENEGSALRFYQIFALEYYKQGSVEEAVVALKRGMASAKANDQTAKVPLLNLLASIYVQKAKTAASLGNSSSEREMALQMAATLLNEAERISRSDPNTCVVRGMLALAKRQPDVALAQFQMALQTDVNIAALLGKARVLYGKQQYSQALAAYQQALVLRPRGGPDPRIGIGMCLERLGHTEDARRALNRASEVDPKAAAPRILLATMDLNASKLAARADDTKGASEHLRDAMEHLQAAYALQPENAAVLLRLADRMCWRGDWEAARKLSERALRAADTMALQAEAHYQVGRAHHGSGRFDAAHEAYACSLAINERHALARYGLAQMLLQRADMSGAEAAFQRVLDRHPRCSEALRALGYLHARLPNTKAKALEYYERAMAELNDSVPSADAADADLFLEAALLYEATSARKACRSYRAAAQLLEGSATPPLAELWNNVGALALVCGEEDREIQAAFAKAAAALGGKSTTRVQQTRTTLAYNVALYYERCGLWRLAQPLYNSVLQAAPGYADARLRLAHIALAQRNDPTDALALVSQALETDARKASAWLMRGRIELSRKNVQDARRAFEHVLRDIAKHDIYALCSLGNYYLAAARSEMTRAQEAPDQKGARDLALANYRRAIEFFDKCLTLDENCAAAAHGAAIAMAERGFAADARRIFQDVRDAATAGLGPAHVTAPSPDLVYRAAPALTTAQLDVPLVTSDVILWASVNAAHALVDVANYHQAILAYEACLRRLQDTAQMLELPSADAQSLVVPGIAGDMAENNGSAASEEPPVIERISETERAERTRVERDIRLYLVRAMYLHAKATKDIDMMNKALDQIRVLCSVIDFTLPESPKPDADGDVPMDDDAVKTTRLSPDHGQLLFDLALLEQSVAQMVSEQPETIRTLAALDQASQDLSHSTSLFSFLALWGKHNQKKQKLQFSARLATERSAYGKSLVAKLGRKRKEQEEFETQRQQSLDQWKRQQEEEERRKKEDIERNERQQKELEDKLLRENDERNQLLRQQLALEHEEQAREAAMPKPKKMKMRQEDMDDMDDDDDDGFVVSPRKRKTAVEPLDQDSARFKSKAIVSDSDDDDDVDDAPDADTSDHEQDDATEREDTPDHD
ncbi:protein required for normal CLN1 and CLN2 G1 cyclin expression [Coemansia sp. RSA 1722]|nr:protein required for normal CLN1 and CLN2 G1 cyclin expression [Coemansia sp. RSA 486]KAJ2599754.1 protein required for normal CLN1 and CLN2 G1 cyclin expression [Coemansia sp. RSA 1721]KAJ2601438.1 protein required for normal CLN1 and CLN2 G1 cyclin expression [Coemansia sp. RSA 1722]KAJ2637316.1 protein required for normal CLN1 and CLN2 G1 cyclin expression [Coemansia sp. RSA 1286]